VHVAEIGETTLFTSKESALINRLLFMAFQENEEIVTDPLRSGKIAVHIFLGKGREQDWKQEEGYLDNTRIVQSSETLKKKRLVEPKTLRIGKDIERINMLLVHECFGNLRRKRGSGHHYLLSDSKREKKKS
jgi:hypothetical protein